MSDDAADRRDEPSNRVKDPADWVTGDEPMTEAQRAFLQSLSDRTGTPFDEHLSKAEASQRIDELRGQSGGGASDGGSDTGGGTGSDDGGGATGTGVQRDPADWVTGDEPMTGAQRSYLQTLASEAGEEVDENLTKAEASKRIDELQARTGRGQS